jgi:alkylation response protein AidB-like acyl-CoA dehydrogenase
VLLEYGTAEQKAAHIPAILKGDEVWVQMLSEPGGGSDVAGATTAAVREGDTWILNGSKVWTSRAWWADWGLCLARTNWNVPKHDARESTMMGASTLHSNQIDKYELRSNDGLHLVTLDLS